ncbi:MAG: phosphoadenylyl-sulfate reductase [Deltaproteobacteria bacterium]|nr:phosphoadenylyl-sulfate reductase [Deltaproteobacteria bacterium]
MNLQDIGALAEAYAEREPQALLALALEEFGGELGVSFSGAEDVVLVDMAVKLGGAFRVFTLDTGRLHPETYRYLEDVRSHYKRPVEVYFPQPAAVQDLVTRRGLFSFFEDGHQECCGVRKVEPLTRALAGLRAWVTGQRRDQSPNTRTHVPVAQWDRTFGTAERPILKLNPLANWTSAQVWDYIVTHEVPRNPLHEKGFRSIGCEPCTRPVHPGQHEREGRWWWEEATKKECGLHKGNLGEG